MAETVKRIPYYYTFVSGRPGQGAKVMNTFKSAGVNLLAYNGFPSEDKAQLDFVPANEKPFLSAAAKAGIKLVGPKTAFLIQGDDRIGAVANVTSKLAAARINITAMNAVASGGGKYGAVLWVDQKKVKQAAEVLGIS